jgi:multisubunit Na+/H+ antiporter MnhB subunit
VDGVTSTGPASEPTSGRDPRRERLVALLLLGIAAVLLVSSVTWFGSGRPGVGVGQLVLGGVLGVLGGLLYRRATR